MHDPQIHHTYASTCVMIRGKNYPVTTIGSGLPCLPIGIGSLMQRTLSNRFKELFAVHSSDLYWVKPYQLENPQALTIQHILEDIATLGSHLSLPPYILLGHSAYGIVALEFAKLYPHLVKGIILIGTPLNSNQEVAKKNNAYFDTHADENRKKIDAQKRVAFEKDPWLDQDFSTRFLYRYIFRNSARYWHNPLFDCTPLWEGIVLDEVLDHFFANILPSIDVKKDLATIECPIFLAAGMSDYDCCPWDWATLNILPKNMTIKYFNQSGHYPHLEEKATFDDNIEKWCFQHEIQSSSF